MMLWLLALAASVMSCGGGSSTDEKAVPDAPSEITVSSSAFQDGQPIPARFTCEGDGEAPPLSWKGVPDDAAALALVVDDPDAPGGTYVHWVVLDMPVETPGLEDGALPTGAVEAKNSAGRAGYAGPCPPSGTHHYRFTIYAMSAPTGLDADAGLDKALAAIEASATAQGRLVGTYAKSN